MSDTPVKDHHHAFHHALNGLIYTYKNHSNLRTHTGIALLVIILGFWLGLSQGDWVIITFTIFLVFVCEMINTAIEALGDAITLQYNQEIKIAKDVSAGMVFLSALGAALIGVLIFGPYLLNLIS